MLYMTAFYIFLYNRKIQYNILFVHVHNSCNFSTYCRKIQKANLKTMVTRKQSMQNFPKSNIFYPLIWIRKWLEYQEVRNHQEVRNISFRKILCALFSCCHRFEFRPLALLPMYCFYIILMFCNTFLTT